ncbi:hypothetical protein H2200_006145 [Cladophialophora chaetospira]|uniref:Heterokaryon incompatibility domain-containing protein n=1 Tax=Cladophialophora chaetospira TaxID=386627 RepID=A0AA38XAM2_9EURO|nr:hypothetical protein H2200_006145 [Cladophialophora chaetospira]
MSLALGALASLRASVVSLQGWMQEPEQADKTWHIHLPRVVDPEPPSAQKLAGSAHPAQTRNNDESEDNLDDLQDDVDHPDFDEKSKWPRRLLHVPTMTSHKWQPENCYNGVKSPECSIVIYTWGRWRIRDPQSTVDALVVHEVPWDIPKVDPDHFTAEQFKQVLHLVAENSEKGYTTGEPSPFVWIDVACIPQRRNSRVADSEIGRQARIFRGARSAYVWLTTADPVELGRAFSKSSDKQPQNVAKTLDVLCKLLEDPWFGSMWTLQESYIQQAAYVMTNSGLCNISERKRPLDLFYARGVATDLFEREDYEDDEMMERLARFRDLWFRAGLQGPLSTSPVQVLACARFRTTEYELDRVYGIMQIFGDEFRVGKTRVARSGCEAMTPPSFTLPELEDELGALILEKFPSTSQLFQHDTPPLAGKAWRICGAASVPRQLGFASGSFNDGLSMLNKEVYFPKPDCTLGTLDRDSTKWATFQGKVSPFEKIVICTRSSQFMPIWTEFHLYLDAGLDFSAMNGAGVNQVLQHFEPDSLMVLLLSVRENWEVGRTIHFDGLLLLKPGDEALKAQRVRREWQPNMEHPGHQAWARIGVCQMVWYEGRSDNGSFMSSPEVNTLLGVGSEWEDQSGIWG